GGVLGAWRFYYEDRGQPYSLRRPFWQDQEIWRRNSPLYAMEKATTPLLLLCGEFDASPDDMERVYSILHGRGVPVEYAMYWAEGHIVNSPGNLRDLWLRTEAFFRRYLRP